MEAANLSVESVFKIIIPETRATVESPTVLALRDGVHAGLQNHTLLLAKDEQERTIGPVDHSATPIRNQHGELTGVVLVFRDTTKLYAQEQKVQLALAYVVAMTGYGQEEDKQRSIEAGFNCHLVQQADFKQVKEILGPVLENVS